MSVADFEFFWRGEINEVRFCMESSKGTVNHDDNNCLFHGNKLFLERIIISDKAKY